MASSTSHSSAPTDLNRRVGCCPPILPTTFMLLRTVFTVADPVRWTSSPTCSWMADLPHSAVDRHGRARSAQGAMYAVGVIEIVAGILVALRPRLGAPSSRSGWSASSSTSATIPGFYDVALRTSGCSWPRWRCGGWPRAPADRPPTHPQRRRPRDDTPACRVTERRRCVEGGGSRRRARLGGPRVITRAERAGVRLCGGLDLHAARPGRIRTRDHLLKGSCSSSELRRSARA